MDCHEMHSHLLGNEEYDDAMDGPDCYRRRRSPQNPLFYHKRWAHWGVKHVQLIHKTEKAYLLKDNTGREFWLPKTLVANSFFQDDPNKWLVWKDFCLNPIN